MVCRVVQGALRVTQLNRMFSGLFKSVYLSGRPLWHVCRVYGRTLFLCFRCIRASSLGTTGPRARRMKENVIKQQAAKGDEDARRAARQKEEADARAVPTACGTTAGLVNWLSPANCSRGN